MADEQDWASYPDQAHVAATDTFLLRTAAGAGVEVAGAHVVARRADGGPFVPGDNMVFGATSFPSASATSGTAMGIAGNGSVFVQNRASADPINLKNKTSWTSGYTNFDSFLVNGVAVGSIGSNGTTTGYNTTSDRRVKIDIVAASDAGPVIDAVEIVAHGWKRGGEPVRFGVIAQDLHEVFPEAVVEGDEDRLWAVDYSKMVPLLLQEVKALRARVAALEAATGASA